MNVAARMESNGEVGRVHISAATAVALDPWSDYFVLHKREAINVKGKGPMETYWLEASPTNPVINEIAIQNIKAEAAQILESTNLAIDKDINSGTCSKLEQLLVIGTSEIE